MICIHLNVYVYMYSHVDHYTIILYMIERQKLSLANLQEKQFGEGETICFSTTKYVTPLTVRLFTHFFKTKRQTAAFLACLNYITSMTQ